MYSPSQILAELPPPNPSLLLSLYSPTCIAQRGKASPPHSSLSSLPPETPPSLFFSCVARHLPGRPKRKTGIGLLPWLSSSKLHFPTLLAALTSFSFLFLTFKMGLTLSLSLSHPPIFILCITPCETIPRLPPN